MCLVLDQPFSDSLWRCLNTFLIPPQPHGLESQSILTCPFSHFFTDCSLSLFKFPFVSAIVLYNFVDLHLVLRRILPLQAIKSVVGTLLARIDSCQGVMFGV